MGFYWIGFVFWCLIGVSLVFFIWGLVKRSWELLVASGIISVLPSMYFLGAENGFRLLVFVPLIPFLVAHYFRKKPVL